MGQVPQKKSYVLVGSGRLAQHLSHYFDQLGLKYGRWSRNTHGHLPIPPADTTLLLISDGAIEAFISAHEELQGRRLVHCSGRLVTSLAEGLHPLMTFTENAFYAVEVYKQIPFVGETERRREEPALPDLPNPTYDLPQKDRALYHALCVLSGNFSVLLWNKFFAELQSRWDIPSHAAHAYLRQITANLIEDSASALTGPLVRRDHQTIEANLQSLQGDAYQSVYRAFVEAYMLERGTL